MTTQNLYDASRQWATRPDDQRFETLTELRDTCKQYADNSRTATVPMGELRVDAVDGDLKLLGKTGTAASLTHYAMGQLSEVVGAPPRYLRGLPATLAAQNINHGLKVIEDGNPERKASLLFHQNGQLVTRSLNSDSYDRVWNHNVADAIINRMVPEGWVVPPARPVRAGQKGSRKATEADVLKNQGDFGLAVKVGDDIAPAGLYASDHDLFIFMCQEGFSVGDGQKLLNRGIFIQNSEVGDCALKFKMFLVDNICGNHIAWGVSNVTEISVRHIKSTEVASGFTLNKGMSQWELLKAKLPSQAQLEADIKTAQSTVLGATKEEVLEGVFSFAKKKGLNRLGKKVLEGAYTVAEQNPRYGNPRTVWAMVNGLTELSQTTTYTDQRMEIDLQSGRVMEMAF